MNACCETPAFDRPRRHPRERCARLSLIGPPNSGKSTLFNRLTGLRQKVANYPGVTVEQRMGLMSGVGRDDLTLIDLPGIYSLTPYSEDARVAVDVLEGQDARHAQARRGYPGSRFPAPHPAADAGRAGAVAGPAYPGPAQHERPDGVPRRQDRCAAAGPRTGRPGGPDQRHPRHRPRGGAGFSESAWQGVARAPLTLPVLGTPPAPTPGPPRSAADRLRAPLSAEASRKIDNILLHRVWGPLLFLVVVVGVFEVVFSIGQPLSDGFGDVLARMGEFVRPLLPAGWLQSLVLDGAWKGISSVLVFLPQILLLFLFIGILEDSGYLARAALIADRVMRTTGLNGKAFIPLLSAYACAVPAIMATRTIENRRDRMATILVTPFMTCSARLPVYMLLIAAFIPNITYLHGFLGLRTLVMLGLYLAGFVAAMTTAWLLKSSILKSSETPFILELPQYRRPTLRALGMRLYDRARVFLRQAGTVILCVTLVLWALAHLPVIHLTSGAWTVPDLANSLIGRLGHFIEPVIAPLGFNWKIGIGLLSSVLAREVMVSTMGTLYGADPGTQALNLQTALHHDMTLGGAIALMIFFAFAMQCTSTMAVVRRETNSWKWPAIQFGYMLVLAYGAAFVVNHLIMAIFG